VGAVATPADVARRSASRPRCRGSRPWTRRGKRPKGRCDLRGCRVDIDAGGRVVARIASTVATTHRAGVLGGIGASAGCSPRSGPLPRAGPRRFDRRGGHQAAGGCRHRPLRHHRHRPRRHVRRRSRLRGGRAALPPRLHRHRPGRPGHHRHPRRRGRGGLPAGGLCAARRRDGRAPGSDTELDIAGLRSAWPSATRCSAPSASVTATYSSPPSPGLRSNGYTLARHVLLDRAELPLNGPRGTVPAHARRRAAQALGALRPGGPGGDGHRPRRRPRRRAHHRWRLAGNLARVLPPTSDASVATGSWEVPRIFHEIARSGDVEPEEMERVFNLGVGMVLIVENTAARSSSRSSVSRGTRRRLSARLVPGEGAVVLEGSPSR